ncbi:hypothetical protein Lgra_0337 [Legionella gratiana]|uniref:FCP1 homology domain-containing protein n=2 Tax=Legionella gratiana TaxID=45066 RepID=A0A378JAG2_9GAMM|nr:hypothetical protein Lgra_0337 [Legionella gratiana]STX44783.1 Uncharacterised protein [Legionella gratiana]
MHMKNAKLSQRRLFVLDIDENLASIQFDEGEPHSLSKSAERSLSQSPSGTVDKPELIPGMLCKKATAFRQDEWKTFFEEIITINERYKKQSSDNVPLISIIFLTNASYDGEKFMNNVFKHFFGAKLTEQLVPDPIGFYNRQNQLKDMKYLDKSDYLEYLFPHLQNKFALLNRSQIILVDDSQINIYGAKEYGFSAIHHPSNPTQRPSFFTFTTHGAQVFQQMHQVLKEADDFVSLLENKLLCSEDIRYHS